MIKIRFYKNKQFKIVAFCITCLLCLLANLLMPIFNGLVGVALLFISALSVLQVKDNKVLLVLFLIIAYVNLVIFFSYYFFPSHIPDFMSNQINALSLTKGICCMTIFNGILYLFVRPQRAREFPYCKSNWLFYTLYILTCIGLMISVVFKSNSLISKLAEYLLIPIIFLCFFGNKSKNKRILILLFLALYCFCSVYVAKQDTVTTGRITILQAILLVILCLYINKLKFRHILGIGFVGIFAMAALGLTRTGGAVSFSNAIKSTFDSIFFGGTFTFAYGSSLTFIQTADTIVGFSVRIKSFLQFILSIFIGSGRSIVALGNVPTLTSKYFLHYNGGLMPMYFYFWGGWIGVLASGALLAFIINKASESESSFSGLFICLSAAMVFRWYVYNPILLFRLSLLIFMIVYLMLANIIIPIIKGKRLLYPKGLKKI